jgi:hypothetical protein
MEKYAQMLRQYLGSMGCKVSMLGAEELIEVSKLAFDVPGRNIVEIAAKVRNLGPRERSARVREAIRKHWPEPTVLWPAHGNARKLLKKEIQP